MMLIKEYQLLVRKKNRFEIRKQSLITAVFADFILQVTVVRFLKQWCLKNDSQ